jgi:acetyltransferase
MSIRNFDRLFEPRSIALVGATDRPGSVGAVVFRNLRRAGFTGELLLVNPHRESLDGIAVSARVEGLPRVPDLAVVATPPETVPGLIAALGRGGTKAAVVLTAGFDETGAHGRALQQAALDAARPHLLRLIGPNCVGIMVPRVGLDASFSHLAPAVGDVAFVSQSGAMVTAMLDWAEPRGIGFSHVVSLGDMADVDFGDMLDWLATDAHTRTILLYVEGLTHGRKFMSAARAAARSKPVLVLKAGHSAAGARVSEAVYDAVFRRAGMLRVATMAELFDAAETLALTRDQQGDRLAILSNGGGAGVLATDALEVAGGRLAQLAPQTIARLDAVLPANWSRGNPVDIIGDAGGQGSTAALDGLLADPGVDAVLVLNCPTALAEPEAAARAVIDRIAAAAPATLSGRNIYTAWLGDHSVAAARRRFSAARIPTYDTPEAAVSGFLHRARYRQNQELLMQAPPARPDPFQPDVAAARAAIVPAVRDGAGWLDAEAISSVLAAYGIRHATDAPARRPGAIELLAGLGEDPVFGPVVLFGQGGAAADLIGDSAAALPPLNPVLARAQMARTRVWRLLQGDRGRPVVALDAVADVLIRLGQLAADHPEIRELDINPLLADEQGVVALDARIRVAAATGEGAARLAIAPYPQHLESRARLRDGTELGLRPIRPEDEPQLHDLAAHMTLRDLRLRFFAPLRGLPHRLAARLTQIDYDREMALLAQAEDGTTIGIARFFADPDRVSAEYAVAVRSDWQGRGVGFALVTRLIDVARQYGIGELVGVVLRENAAMLAMCRTLGFALERDPADGALLRVRKPLAADGRGGA